MDRFWRKHHLLYHKPLYAKLKDHYVRKNGESIFPDAVLGTCRCFQLIADL